MIILSIRTDTAEAEMGLFDDAEKLGYKKWLAHRELSATIHLTMKELLTKSNKSLGDIEGIIVFQGPGSFTGLRIGISVANALASGVQAHVVGSTGTEWLKQGLAKLQVGQNERMIVPEYGAPVHTTEQKH